MDPALSYAIGPPLAPGSYASCWKRIQDAAHRFPDSLALISMHQKSDLYGVRKPQENTPHAPESYLRWTYRDLELASNKVAAALSGLGASMGTPVFTFLPNGVEYVVSYWAASTLGCTFVPLNVRQLDYAGELIHMVDAALHQCQSRTAVIIAANSHVTRRLDKLAQLSHATKFIVDGSETPNWSQFGNLLASSLPSIQRCSDTRPDEHTDSTIMFTSGTTNMPKGCHWHYPHFPSATFAMRDIAGEDYQQKHSDVTAITAPNNHAVGFFYLLMALCNGATALFPGPTFEAETLLSAVKLEGVTHTVAVPTMIQAISDVISSTGLATLNLKHIMIGGSDVSPEVLHQCTDILGAEGVEVIFGMTDGVFISSGKRRPEFIVAGDAVSCGWCLPGCQIKICAPGSRQAVRIGQPGELHYQSITLIDNYIDRQSDDFYHEDGRLWFCTADQAVLRPDGRLFITGRYKDMIIRGGENISPASIEACIASAVPQLAHLQIQVVGAQDPLAGEVPVAITAQHVSEKDSRTIRHAVTLSMGKTHALDQVISIQELGLSELPKTMSGKVQKTRLKDLVRSYYERQRPPEQLDDPKLVTQVKQVWARAVGLGVQDLSLTTEIADLGDSITLMRVKDRLFKKTGLNVSLQEIAQSKTIKDLVDILQCRSVTNREKETSYVAGLAGPPRAEDMVHVCNQTIYKTTRAVVTRTIEPYGLRWDDVRDAFPAYDMTRILAQDGTLDRWSCKIGVVTKGCSVDDLTRAVLETLTNNPMQASFLIWLLGTSTALHVTVNQKVDFLKTLITYRGAISSTADFRALESTESDYTALPGPLIRASIYFVEATHSAAVLYSMHHAVTDAAFNQLIFEDLDQALSGKTLRPHVPYKLYCDSLFALTDSPAAQDAIAYHTSKLKDLSRHRTHIWPPTRSPIQRPSPGNIECTHTFPATALQALCKQRPHLSSSLILKAAFMVFLLTRTNHTHAIFSHLESGRDKFPFLPASLAASSPKLLAGDVGGQTLQVITNLIPAPAADETVLAFLNCLQIEQEQQHRYAAAPWSGIMAGLDGEAAAMIPEIANRCIFNWLGNDFKGQRFENFEIVDGVTRKDATAFTVEAALRKGEADEVVLHARGASFGIEELQSISAEIEALVGLLVDGRNLEMPLRMLEVR